MVEKKVLKKSREKKSWKKMKEVEKKVGVKKKWGKKISSKSGVKRKKIV